MLAEEIPSPSLLQEKTVELEEGAKIIGTRIDKCWLPIKTDKKVFLLNLQNQTKIMLETRPNDASPIQCVVNWSGNGFVVVSQVGKKGVIKTGKLKQSDQGMICQMTDSAMTFDGYYYSYEITADGHWLRLLYGQSLKMLGSEQEVVQNYLIDLAQPSLTAVELTGYLFSHAKRRIAFVSSSHLCVLARDAHREKGYIGFPVYSLSPFKIPSSEKKVEPVVKMPLDNMLGYLPSCNIEHVGSVHQQGFKLSPDGQWLSFLYNPAAGMLNLNIYSIVDAKPILKKSFQTYHSEPRWLEDNTIIFQVVWDAEAMTAGI